MSEYGYDDRETNEERKIERLTAEVAQTQKLYEDASAAGMALGVKYAELQDEVASLKEQLAARDALIEAIRETFTFRAKGDVLSSQDQLNKIRIFLQDDILSKQENPALREHEARLLEEMAWRVKQVNEQFAQWLQQEAAARRTK